MDGRCAVLDLVLNVDNGGTSLMDPPSGHLFASQLEPSVNISKLLRGRFGLHFADLWEWSYRQKPKED